MTCECVHDESHLSEFWQEGWVAKLARKLKQEPLVPLGLAATCWALWSASKSMRKGDKEATNKYFRYRLYAQGFTLVCLCAGAFYYREERQERKYYQGLLGEKRAMEKRDAWIRELELRDREEEEERAARAVRRQRMAGNSPLDDKPVSSDSMLEASDLRALVGGSRILGPAMAKWWSGSLDNRTRDE